MRKGLLGKGAASKYVLYAVGEILLVMIGILLALQVNNWNEERIQDQKALGYAESLLAEVEENIAILVDEQKSYQIGVQQTKKYMEMLNGSDSHSVLNDTLIVMAIYMGPVSGLTLSKSTFDDLINSGSLETFDDSHLRELIMDMGRKFEVLDNSLARSDKFWDLLSEYYVEHANLTGVMNEMIGENLPYSSEDLNREAFIQNRTFTNLLAMRLFRHNRASRAANNLLLTLTDLKSKLMPMLESK